MSSTTTQQNSPVAGRKAGKKQKVNQQEPDNNSAPKTDPRPTLPSGLIGVLVIGIFFLDQLTKYLGNGWLEYGQTLAVFPGFDLLLVYNKGAAFSFLDDAAGWQRWILSGISAIVSLGIMLYIRKVPGHQRLLRVSLAFILGGALGNFYDRIALGYVVDFISVYYEAWRFATFNIADAAISVGAALMVLDIFVSPADDK
jgi:signal peptidase II